MKVNKHIGIIFFIVCVILLATQIFSFIYLADINEFPIGINLLTAISESLLILSPYLLLNGKWRRTVLIPMTLIPVFLYANLLYYRNFCDLMSFQTMFGFQNMTGAVTDSATTSIEAADLWLLMPYILFISLYVLWFKEFIKDVYSILFKIIAIDIIALLFAVNQFYLVSEVKRIYVHTLEYRNRTGNVNTFHYNKFQKSARMVRFQYYSLTPYIFREFIDYVKPEYRSATPEEMAELQAFINGEDKPILQIFDSLPDNKGKNLIVIIVESFNSDGLYASPCDKPAMPYLTSLIANTKDVIVLDNITPQIGEGRSSDGRFIYNTGILPPPRDPVAMAHPVAHYPSLAKAFNGEAEEFDVGHPRQWNKMQLSKSYGYRKIHTDSEMLKNADKLGGKDIAMFVNAIPLLEKMHQPFLATLCTMDMHDPYETFPQRITDAWKDTTYTRQECVYVEKLRKFDASLSHFIVGLKRAGLYDNSVIAIVSDHTARESMLPGNHFVHRRIPAIILNSGIELRSSAPIAQTDIFPTLLDVIGKDGYEWRGFGTSVFRNPKFLEDKEYNLSDSMIQDAKLQRLSETMLETGQFK